MKDIFKNLFPYNSRVLILALGLTILLFLTTFLGGCSPDRETVAKEGMYIVTSTSILADITSNIVGDLGTVEYLVPIGESPEDYEMIPSDMRKINDADVVILNGLGLENMILRTLQNVSNAPVVFAAEDITPIPLEGSTEPDPHAWLNPTLVKSYVETIYYALSEQKREYARVLYDNAQEYIQQLSELHHWTLDEIAKIPESYRVIVMSENALKYFGDAYGFETVGIWELNAHEEGTPQQISRVVDIVRQKQLPALFIETTVDTRYMKTIENETKVPIAGALYTDAIGKEGSNAESYVDMMKHNVGILVKGLSNRP
ncbi:hypothetical protein BHU72_00920 [Desulfuribacillus stibiiarsenatis]|uniref:Manganese transporter n=1 Tax=Desulfuribacillus stibiiarsenatis TaxID=1390249 RepID=A0A1E5L9W2_9FIRM|nr:zinc ABC transporter substrate-binding protein [Desulfuribacillus stibiiarsenatis]OEH86858.1 hypothetical protein BHU72_00920 [Desulfuribacillus stibiiarsenatis]